MTNRPVCNIILMPTRIRAIPSIVRAQSGVEGYHLPASISYGNVPVAFVLGTGDGVPAPLR
jgi:hypothetical protein